MPAPKPSRARKLVNESLVRIEQRPSAITPRRFLQHWDATHGLTFLCQNSTDAVEVNRGGCKKVPVKRGLVSRLHPRAIRKYRKRQKPTAEHIHAALVQVLRQYVRFQDERTYDLVAIWIMGSYLYTAFSNYGYLFFHSRQKRSGKTRSLEIISVFAFQASPVLTAPTAPSLRETAAEGSTLVLDTIERWKHKNSEAFHAAMEMLDAGFKNGSHVSLMKKDGNGNHEKTLIPVYAPYALAGIGASSLSDTAQDRAFNIEMHRKHPRDTVARFREDKVRLAHQDLMDDLFIWALRCSSEIRDIYEDEAFNAIVNRIGLHDRATDIWLPILAISKTVSQEVFQRLQLLAATMGSESPESIQEAEELMLLEILQVQCEMQGNKWRAMTSEIEALAASAGVTLNASAIRQLLEGIAGKQKQARLAKADGESRRAWHLNSVALKAAIAERKEESAEMG